MQRSIPGVLAALLSLCVTPGARAADPAIAAAETHAQLALTAGYSDYEENLFPQDTETGAAIGLRAGLSALLPLNRSAPALPDLYGGMEYDFSAGLMNYRGNLQSPGFAPYRAKDTDYDNTAIVRLGLGLRVDAGMELIPYLAGGYQNWYRNIGGAAGYDEFYQSGLVGGGIKLDVATAPPLVLSVAAESFAVVGGGVSAPAQDFSGAFGTSAEERVSLDADYRFTGAWHAFAGLGFTHYGYTGSKPNPLGAYEPLSTTFRINSMFGISYGF